MIVQLHRGIWKTDKSLIGLIYPPGIEPLFVLELPWRDNKENISCIPAGWYTCVRKPCSKNKKWKEGFFIQDTLPRKDVICGHIGCYPKDTDGCQLFGLYHPKPDMINGSTDAIYKWRDAMAGIDEFELRIIE